LVRAGLVVSVVSALLSGAANVFAAGARANASPGGLGPFGLTSEAASWVLAGVLTGWLAGLLVILGRAACCGVPRDTGIRGLAAASACSTAVAGLFYAALDLGAALVSAEGATPDALAIAVVGLAGFLLAGLIGEFLFLRFLYRVGQILEGPELMAAVVRFSAFLCVLMLGEVVAAAVLGVVGAGASPPTPRAPVAGKAPVPAMGVESLIALVTLVASAILLLAYFNLVRTARHVVAGRLAQRAVPEATHP
jgi:hypothetical protein